MLDLNKPVRTKGGRPARILATDLPDPAPLAVLVGEHLYRYRADGYVFPLHNTIDCLENVPEKRTVFLNVYNSLYHVSPHPSRELADKYASTHRIACIEVTYSPGDGL